MQKIKFADSAQSTIGVEWEIALVDHETADLCSVAERVLCKLKDDAGISHEEEHPTIKPELLMNTVEVVTGVHHTVAEAAAELRENVRTLSEVTTPMGVDLYCAGSHPFAAPTSQPVTDKDRYANLIDRTQWWGRQMVIYGVHVHVGLNDREKALPITDGLINYQPHFQALSASSPYWGGEDTGYASQRALMFQQLPTAGIPFHFNTWSEYEAYVADMLYTGVIDDISEIRWDVRPVARLGTVEMRICDGMSSLEDISAITALTQCLVHDMSLSLEAGNKIPVMPDWYRVENKWRAARYGLDAIIILNAQGDEMLVTDHLRSEVKRLTPISEQLGCADELQGIIRLIERGAEYQLQREVFAASGGDFREIVRNNVSRMLTQAN
ncbi:carboxylate--amine ligase [Arthrobacter sp. YC-RL1]|uniref:Putative glutamate--cysteine ligase 2 n=1 Tax=Glutamicibacter soli TaxID=453836 RepID=A0A365YCM1_9MICC|nr:MULTISPECIES: glutamate--cysteine ligase [Micrococcaceae]ALD64492.1 carboxylate--amine ligase [Arthrobacter sp. LS16]ALQ30222.1 carboxylate--amine ligase [Arthrobacter sp. YC-RL1]KLI88459.1 carboxylate--amine ligase [Arthrobacter sp. YC-RL1]RBM00436.1 glutamate--cysteine ligase [Glutamicibacter soli]